MANALFGDFLFGQDIKFAEIDYDSVIKHYLSGNIRMLNMSIGGQLNRNVDLVGRILMDDMIINAQMNRDFYLSGNIKMDDMIFNADVSTPVYFSGNVKMDDMIFDIGLNSTNFRFVDFTKSELIVSGSGASKFLSTQVDQESNLGGFPSGTRLENFSIIRKNPIETLNVTYISGNSSDGNLEVQMVVDDSSSSYTIQYKAPDSTSFGEPVEVEYNKELKLYDIDIDKYIFVELYESTTINRTEIMQLRYNYNNVISMNNFDKTNPDPQYRAIYFRNSFPDPIENLTLWTDENTKILTEFAAELPIDKEITTIVDGTTAPSTISVWNSYFDSTSAVEVLPELRPGSFVGLWVKNSLIDTTSSDVSPLEKISLNYKFNSVTLDKEVVGNVSGLTRIYDEDLENKYKVYYNINENLDGTGVSSVIIDSTGDFPYNFLSSSELDDGDLLYYDLVRLNRYGLESIKNPNQFVKYIVDGTGETISSPPSAPNVGNTLYNTSGELLIQANYFPADEPVITNRAYKWSLDLYIADTSSVIDLDVEIPMDNTSGISGDIEVLNYIIDSTSNDLLDGTPIFVNVFTENESGRSLTSYDLSGEIIKQISTLSPQKVHQLHGENQGIHKSNLEPFNETIVISDTSGNEINYVNDDGSIELNRNGVVIFKAFYRGENDIFNKFYLRSDYTIDSSSSFSETSTITDNLITYEVEDSDTMYFLVNLNRKMKIDFNSKTISLAGDFIDSTPITEIFSDNTLFPRYAETIFNIFDVRDQYLTPFGILDTDGNFTTLLELDTQYSAAEIASIL